MFILFGILSCTMLIVQEIARNVMSEISTAGTVVNSTRNKEQQKSFKTEDGLETFKLDDFKGIRIGG